ncbi:MBL fold metallo-hydrolase [Aggregatilinea lenta]|uniref:MBL fold metallo-hydrolase n=1 Tax=Aggregatilinea lenta TaxID=913108 RepID=UPI000E5A464F|nr:MBL fold metallo-hydrolase [Aggregatilinea lenta]
MEITWYGHSCFRITERGRATVVTDPFGESLGYEVPKLKAEVVTISHDSPGHNNVDMARDCEHVVSGPGEYEVGGVFIIGVATYNREIENPRLNVIYVLDFAGLSVAHLGDLDHVPNQSMVESLGPIDVALVPVGDGGALSSSQAAEVISLLEPSIVVPMHFQTEALRGMTLDPVDRFLKEMGIDSMQAEPVLKVTAGGLPEQTQVVLLDYRH